MKQWTVYYRDKNGSKASVVIEAEDRSGVFAELKKRGISAISVTEGASNKKPRKVAKNSASSKGRGLIAAAIVVLVAGVAAWFMWPEEKKVVEEKKVEVKKQIKAEPKKIVKRVHDEELKKPEKKTVEKRNKHEEYMSRQRAAMAKKLGRKKEHAIVTNNLCSAGKSVYKNATEQIMLQVFGTELGDMPEPLPVIPQRDKKRLVEILMNKAPVTEKDSEEVALDKEILAEAKSALAQFIKEGGEVDEFFSYYHRQLESAYRRRVDARRLVVETARSGEVELAKEALLKYNEKLQADGIKPITLPEAVFKQKGNIQ